MRRWLALIAGLAAVALTALLVLRDRAGPPSHGEIDARSRAALEEVLREGDGGPP